MKKLLILALFFVFSCSPTAKKMVREDPVNLGKDPNFQEIGTDTESCLPLWEVTQEMFSTLDLDVLAKRAFGTEVAKAKFLEEYFCIGKETVVIFVEFYIENRGKCQEGVGMYSISVATEAGTFDMIDAKFEEVQCPTKSTKN